jgi:hypothetical protein
MTHLSEALLPEEGEPGRVSERRAPLELGPCLGGRHLAGRRAGTLPARGCAQMTGFIAVMYARNTVPICSTG